MYDASEILKDYIGKRFSPNPKANFIAFIKEKTEIKFSEKKSYDALFSEIEKKIGKKKLFSILGIKDIEEAEMRSCLADAFYKALVETTWLHQFSPLYERLTGERIKIKRKVEKKEPAYRLAFSADENEFINAWIDLYKEGILPPIVHYENIVIGPLGWIRSIEKREKDFLEKYSQVFNILDDKFDEESTSIIISNFLYVIEQIIKEPDKFKLQQEKKDFLDIYGNRTLKYLEQIKSEKDDDIRYAMSIQLIHTHLEDDDLIHIVNRLIADELIKSPKVRGLYERYPYSFSDWVITPYGLIKQVPSWKRRATEELAELIKKEFKQEDIEPDLEKYHGNYDLRILEYCIRENPEEISDKCFALPKLRAIAKKLGIPAASRVKNKEEIIRLILLRLGFSVPPIITGLKDYQNFLKECRIRIDKDESLSGIMTDVYRETQNVLRDIAYFYIRFLWHEEDINKIIRKEIGLRDYKPFEKLGLGHFIELIRTLNTKVRKDAALKERLHDSFARDYVLSKENMSILDEISATLSILQRHEKGDKKECLPVLDKLMELSEFIKKEEIYPKIVRITRELTNEFGVEYFEAMDDENNEWIIKKKWLDPSLPYFMHSNTKPVAVDPIIIKKIF